jgi:hypothetical protein
MAQDVERISLAEKFGVINSLRRNSTKGFAANRLSQIMNSYFGFRVECASGRSAQTLNPSSPKNAFPF